jgi:hypothetical protein
MCPHFQAVFALLISLLAQTPSPPAKAQLPVPSRPTKTQPAVEASSDRVIRATERINRIFGDSGFDPTLFPGSAFSPKTIDPFILEVAWEEVRGKTEDAIRQEIGLREGQGLHLEHVTPDEGKT